MLGRLFRWLRPRLGPPVPVVIPVHTVTCPLAVAIGWETDRGPSGLCTIDGHLYRRLGHSEGGGFEGIVTYSLAEYLKRENPLPRGPVIFSSDNSRRGGAVIR